MAAAERRELIEQAAMSVFAERSYLGASIDEIARRAGVSAPVIYDHFESKLDLYRRLLERTRNELLEVWREHLFVEGPVEERAPKALKAWAAYVESHRVQTRMYFREAAGEPDAWAVQQEIHAQARVDLGVVVAREPGAAAYAGGADQETIEMAGEVLRAGLAGLALWWHDHQHVPRERIVRTAYNVLWVGFERAHS
jgi:AcrR family transcriptional regulator